MLDSKGRELCHRERSLSLNHIASADARSLDHSSNRERSFSLNHTASADEGGSPSSFSNRQEEPSVPEMEAKNIHTDEGKRQACYVNTMPCLGIFLFIFVVVYHLCQIFYSFRSTTIKK